MSKLLMVVFTMMSLGLSLNSYGQAYVNATLLKYRVDTGVTLKTTANKVRASTEGGLMKAIVDFVLSNTDTLGGTGGALQSVLDNGNEANIAIKLGKIKSTAPYNSTLLSIDATDSSGSMTLRDSSAGLLFAANKTQTYSKVGVTTPYIIGTGSAPTLTLNACAGAGATYTITGTQGHGYVAITAGSSPCGSTNSFFTINFPVVFGGVPSYISISPRNNAAADIWVAGGILYSAASTTSSATITRSASTIIESTVYEYYYNIEQ